MTVNRTFRTSIAGLVLALLAGAARAEDYAVRLDRPSKVGDKERISIVADSKRVVTASAAGAEPKREQETWKITIDGTSETLAVDAQGNETKASIVIERCELVRDGGKAEQVVAKGQTLLAELVDAKTVFRVKDGDPLPEELQEPLDAALALHDPGESSDDQVFGAAERKHVGDAWPASAKFAAADLRHADMTVKEEDVSGTARLVGVVEEAGVPCLHLQVSITAKNCVPKDTKDATGSFQASVAALYPVDTSAQPLRASLATKATLRTKEAAADGGVPLTVSMALERTRSIKATPVK